MRKIDHIVYCTDDLEAEVKRLEEKLGCPFSPGGRHLNEGTKNKLLNLGNGCYFELLAVDKDNTEIQSPRWMGIDVLTKSHVTRWALKTSDPHSDSKIVKKYNPEMGQIKGGQRITSEGKKLEWDLVMPLSKPEVEIIPFMTDWSKSDVHPTESLPEYCSLLGLELFHPNPQDLQPYLDLLVHGVFISKGAKAKIQVKIQSPNGIVIL
jgi:hypothetical protein